MGLYVSGSVYKWFHMQKLLLTLTSIFILGVVLRLSIGHFSADRIAIGLLKSEDKSAILSGCDNLNNCTASTASTKKNYIKPIEYQKSNNDVIKRIAAVISVQKGTMIRTQDTHYLHATYKTALLGYMDDLELLLDNSSGILHIRSASRIGRSDFGVNRKRIEALRALLQGKI